ncbi:MAG: DUF2520 domain-containing protein [Deltaproteobacteria bacterium]|nr:DUF2520 domain-containing protein [Deltaproteobacteria bacterium]
MTARRVAIIGAGVVGTAVGALLAGKGYRITGIASRRLASAEKAVRYVGAGTASEDVAGTAGQAEVIFITTPDGAIRSVCEKIVKNGGVTKESTVIHCCGAHSADLLDPARSCGASVLSIHPLQTMADIDQAVRNLPGSYFALDGDEKALTTGRALIRALGGTAMVIPSEGKMLYHGAAVVACNYFVALIFQALRMFEAIGIPREEGLPALMPLIGGTVKNLERVGIPKALTGPIERGDVETIEGHLAAFDALMPDGRKIYCELGRIAVDVAEAKGSIRPETQERLLKLLNVKSG